MSTRPPSTPSRASPQRSRPNSRPWAGGSPWWSRASSAPDFLDAVSLNTDVKLIEDYAPTAGAMREAAASLNHAQPGDPAKAARAIVEMTAAAEPPLRLPLGTDTLQAVQATLDGIRAEMDAWRHIAAGTDHT